MNKKLADLFRASSNSVFQIPYAIRVFSFILSVTLTTAGIGYYIVRAANTTIGNNISTSGTLTVGSTSLFSGNIAASSTLQVTGTTTLYNAIVNSGTATSTFANGIQLSGGCFQDINGNCLDNSGGGGGSGTVNSGTQGQIAFYETSSTEISGTSTIFLSTTTLNVGIGTTTPGAKLSVAGTSLFNGLATFYNALFGNISATGTLSVTGLSTFGNASSTQISSSNSAYFATTGGAVGIGTTSPFQKLSVHGNALISGDLSLANLTATGTASISGNTSVGGTLSVTGVTTLSNASTTGMITAAGGFISSASSTVAGAFNAGDTTITGTQSVSGLATLSGGFIAASSSVAEISATRATTTNATSTTLYVSGTLSSGTSTVTNLIVTNTSTSTIAGGLAVQTDKLVVDKNTGNVGIGSTTPGAKLSVSGTSLFDGLATIYRAIFGTISASSTLDVSGKTTLANASTSQLTASSYFQAGGDSGLTVLSSGFAGLGTTSPSRLFSVHGSALFSGDILAANITATGTFTTTGLFTFSNASGTQLTTTNNTYLSTDGGNTGVGTTSPSQKLAVQGSALISGNISSADITATGTVTTANLLATGSTTLQDFTANNATTSQATTTYLAVSGTASTSRIIVSNASFFGGLSNFLSGFISSASSTFASILNVTGLANFSSLATFSNGFVSSASSTVSNSLHVSGNIQASSSLSVANLSSLYGGFISSASSTIANNLTVSGQINSSSTITVTSGAGTSTIGALTIGQGNYAFGTTTPNIAGFEVATRTIALNSGADGSLGAWASTTSAINQRNDFGAVTANGHIYVIGGVGPGGNNLTSVEYAKINFDGSIDSWATTTNILPVAAGGNYSLFANGYIYSIGGTNGSTYNNTVYYSKVNSNGSLSSWVTNEKSFPPSGNAEVGRYGPAAAITNGYIYVLGGHDGAVATTSVIYAKLNSDGSTGPWASTTAMALAKYQFSAVVANGYIYTIGAINVGTSAVNYAKINSDGSLGIWTTTNSLPVNAGGAHAAIVSNGYLYLVQNGGNSVRTFFAKVNSDGTLGAWQTNSSIPQQATYRGAVVAANGYVYNIAGTNYAAGVKVSDVVYSSVARTKISGALDLLGLASSTLSGFAGDNGSVGGSIFAGNIFSAGNLQVTGNSQLWGGLGVNGLFSLTASTSALQTASIFSIQNATGTLPLFNIAYNGGLGVGTTSPISGSVFMNGNFGIGTSTPGAFFAVQGSGLFSGNLGVANLTATGTLTFAHASTTGMITIGNGFISSASSSVAGAFNVSGLTTLNNASSTQLSSTGSAYLATTGGRVGIGTTTPGAKLALTGGSTTGSIGVLFEQDMDNDPTRTVLRIIPTSAAGSTPNGTLLEVFGDNQLDDGGGTDLDPFFVVKHGVSGAPVVAIGTSSPSSLLHLSRDYAGDTDIRFESQAFNWIMGIDNSDTGKFVIASSTALGTNNRFVIDGNGNVGIGTTSPGARFSVTGAGLASSIGALFTQDMDNSASRVLFRISPNAADGASPTGSLFEIFGDNQLNTSSSDFDPFVVIKYGASGIPLIGFGTSSPSSLLHLSKDYAADTDIRFESQDYNWIMGIDNSDGGKFKISSSTALGSTDRFVIDGNGNVGIGNATPLSPLYVAKNTTGNNFSARFLDSNGVIGASILLGWTGGATDAKYKSLAVDSDGFHLAKWDDALTTQTRQVTINGNGNLGIGDVTPSYKLDVLGDARFTGLVDAANFVATSTSVASTFGYRVGIGTTSPSQLLSVHGNALFSGNITSVANITATGTLTVTNSATSTIGALTIGQNNWAFGTTTPNIAGFEVATRTLAFNSGADASVGPWASTTDMINHKSDFPAVVVNGYIYALGGLYPSDNRIDSVEFTKINSNGTLGAWATSTPLPSVAYSSAAVTANGYIYSVGGIAAGSYKNSVAYSRVNSDGTLGAWTTSPNIMPGGGAFNGGRYGAAAVVTRGYLYVIGGTTSESTGTTSVIYTKLNSDGSIGQWASTTELVAAREFVGGVSANGYIYAIGGHGNTTVYYARINNDGTLGGWLSANSLPDGRRGFNQIALINGYLYIFGTNQSNFYSAKVNNDGSLGVWRTNPNLLPAKVGNGAVVNANGYIYYIGGNTADNTGAIKSVVYGSTARTQIAGDLDLIGLSSTTISDFAGDVGSVGSSIFAGSLFAQNRLEVGGNTSLWGGLNVNGLFSLTASTSALQTASIFSIQNATGTLPLFNIAYNGALGVGTTSPISGSVFMNGNFGIGTSTPGAFFAVEGSGLFSGNLSAANITATGTLNVTGLTTLGYASTTQLSSTGSVYLASGNSGTSTIGALTIGQNNWAFGTTTPNIAGFEVATRTLAFNSGSDANLGPWATSSPMSTLPLGTPHNFITANGYVYAVGDGAGGSGDSGRIAYAKLGADGSIGGWASTSDMLGDTRAGAAVVANGYMYIVGEINADTVQYAKIGSRGQLSDWRETTEYPGQDDSNGIQNGTAVAANGYLYAIGGQHGNSAGTRATSSVYYSKMNSDGTIGNWIRTSELATTTWGHASFVANGHVYVVGGCVGLISGCASGATTTTYYARFNTDGTLGAWTKSENMLPYTLNSHSAVVANGYAYVLGGIPNSSGVTAVVLYTKLNADGSIGPWQTTNPMLVPSQNNSRGGRNAFVANGYLYYLKGNALNGYAIFATLPRVSIFGNLSLLGSASTTLSDSGGDFGSVGGSLLAGDIFAQNRLEVSGNTQLFGGLGVSGVFSLTASTSVLQTASIFSIQNATGTQPILNVRYDGSIMAGEKVIIGTTSPTFTSNSQLTVFASTTLSSPIAFSVQTDGSIGPWATTTRTRTPNICDSGAAAANGYLYRVGGSSSCSGDNTGVEFVKINSDGSLGTWATTSASLFAINEGSAAVHNGYLYNIYNASEYAKINSDGSLGAWKTFISGDLLGSKAYAQLVAANGYLYVLGGYDGGAGTTSVMYVKLNSDGSARGTWASTSAMTANVWAASGVAANGYMYMIGGLVNNLTQYAKINPDGTLGPWATTGSTPANGNKHNQAVAIGGYIYNRPSYDTFYRAKINSDGTLTAWTKENSLIPGTSSQLGPVAAWNGYIYSIEGNNSQGTFYSSVTRTQISGSLDLLGTASSTLSSPGGSNGSAGSSLFAGNVYAQNYLEVTGNTQLWGGLGVNDYITLSASTSLPQNISIFNIQNATGTQALLTVLYNGRVGIGTTTPMAGLSVSGGSIVLWEGSTQRDLRVENGAICADNNGGAKCTAALTAGTVYGDASSFAASDVAENYPISDSSIEAGDIVALSNELPPSQEQERERLESDDSDSDNKSKAEMLKATLVKATPESRIKIIGAISTNPGVLLGDTTGMTLNTDTRPVALAGRIPVKVNLEGGAIQVGDLITISSTPGIGKKADSNGKVIGHALENYDGPTEENGGKVLVFVSLDDYQSYSENSSDNSSLLAQAIDIFKDWLESMQVFIENGALRVKDFVAEKITAGKVVTDGIEMTDSETGEKYCVKITNGEFVKTLGECTSATNNSEQTTENPSPSASDTTAPIITLSGSSSITITKGDAWVDPGALVTDPLDDTHPENNNLSVYYKVNGTDTGNEGRDLPQSAIDTNISGAYTITYTATDSAGNIGTAERTLIIEDPIPAPAPEPEPTPEPTPTE